MERNIDISEIMKLIHPLSTNSKLEILSRLTNELKSNISSQEVNKKKLLNQLYGSWKNIDENLIEEILEARTTSEKEIDFD